MTGFGKSSAVCPGKKLTVEIKSLNSKQIDIAARVPSQLRGHELEMRSAISAALIRGKVDLTVYAENVGAESTVKLNTEVLRACKADVERTSEALGIPTPEDWYGVLLRLDRKSVV